MESQLTAFYLTNRMITYVRLTPGKYFDISPVVDFKPLSLTSFEADTYSAKTKAKIINAMFFIWSDCFYCTFVSSFLIIKQVSNSRHSDVASHLTLEKWQFASRTNNICLTRQLFDLEIKTMTPQRVFKSRCFSIGRLVSVNLQLRYPLASHISWDEMHSASNEVPAGNYHFVKSLPPTEKASGNI